MASEAKKAAEKYVQGRITISEAAHAAEMTVFEMEQYLVSEGHKSEYSIEDLEREISELS